VRSTCRAVIRDDRTLGAPLFACDSEPRGSKSRDLSRLRGSPRRRLFVVHWVLPRDALPTNTRHHRTVIVFLYILQAFGVHALDRRVVTMKPWSGEWQRAARGLATERRGARTSARVRAHPQLVAGVW
jgi:hypothetical protein